MIFSVSEALPSEVIEATYMVPEGIHVTKYAEGDYQGTFQLQFTGITERAGHARPDGANGQRPYPETLMRRVFDNLEDGEVVELDYLWNAGAGSAPQFDWRLAGVCRDTSRAKALQRAVTVHLGLDLAFATAGTGMELAKVAKTNASTHVMPYQYDVTPRPVVIPASTTKRSMTSRVTALRQQVILPWPRTGPMCAFDTIFQTGRHIQAMWWVSIRVEALTLSTPACGMLERTYKYHRFGQGEPFHTRNGLSAEITSQGVIKAAVSHLQDWSTDPRGLRVHCRVYADRPLSPALIEAIGCEAFGNRPVTVCQAPGHEMPVCEDSGIVQLVNCVPRQDNPLSLMPSRKALEHIGTRREYVTVPANLPATGITLGQCGRSGHRQEVRLSDEERSRHSYILGATGTGKSTLLYNAIMQDIERGRGVCVVDPHGDLYEQVLHAVPQHRAHDVILVDSTDLRRPVGINFLECGGPGEPAQINFIVDEMIAIFQRLYGDVPEALGPMFETYMRNALYTVADTDKRQATLLDVVRFFEDDSFRARAKAQCRNPMSTSFWDRQAEKAGGEAALQNIATYITSKLNRFTHNALIRPIIGQAQSTIDFRQAMDDERIILVNLAKGVLGELDVRLLGMLIIGKLFNAAMGRITVPLRERRPFHLYLDEFQNFVTPTIIHLLSEARKFGLALTLAHQHAGQLSGSMGKGMLEAILGNVASLLFFRMGPQDARQLETYIQPGFGVHELQHLPDHHVLCRMLNDNEPIQPFVFVTHPAQVPRAGKDRQRQLVTEIKRQSRLKHTGDREAIEAEIKNAWTFD